VAELRHCAGPEDLLALAGDYLVAREAEHNLIFGILGRLRMATSAYGAGEPYLVALVAGGRVSGVVVRTPPYGPVLSELDDPRVTDLVAADLFSLTDELAGVLGPRAAAERFARCWSELSATTPRLTMEQRIYRAESATAPVGVPGAARRFAARDRGLVLTWLQAFGAEAGADGTPAFDYEAWLERQLGDADGEIVFWEHEDRPVSLAVAGQATPNGLRVGPVYTPPELRGRGFATAVTAEITARALAAGRRFCFLFTDLANPTSNAIYQRIGYRPVCDVDQWAFHD
jgi:predicted GNAT family acetyltransferase